MFRLKKEGAEKRRRTDRMGEKREKVEDGLSIFEMDDAVQRDATFWKRFLFDESIETNDD